MASALKEAFLKLDSDIINGGFDSSSPASSVDAQIASALRPAVAGSCAIVAYLEGNDLYIASTGDSRAVLGKRRGDGSFEAIPLSADHTIKNPVEHARMLEEHPGEAVFSRGRVLGGLMPTRAFGKLLLDFGAPCFHISFRSNSQSSKPNRRRTLQMASRNTILPPLPPNTPFHPPQLPHPTLYNRRTRSIPLHRQPFLRPFPNPRIRRPIRRTHLRRMRRPRRQVYGEP